MKYIIYNFYVLVIRLEMVQADFNIKQSIGNFAVLHIYVFIAINT